MSWYNKGLGGLEEEQRRIESKQGPGRLWMPRGASKEVVWVDDEPICIREHNPKINGSFMNWITCLEGVADEVVCCMKLGADSSYYVGYVTLVDCTAYQDKRGNTHQYELRLCPLKLRSLKKLKRKKDDRGAMHSTMWRLTREDEHSPVCGDDWEFMRDVDMGKLFEYVNYRGKRLTELYAEAEAEETAMERLKNVFQVELDSKGKILPKVFPFNYFEVLKPKSPKELRVFLGSVDADNKAGSHASGGVASGPVKQDEIPF